jgi:hypothetical protein
MWGDELTFFREFLRSFAGGRSEYMFQLARQYFGKAKSFDLSDSSRWISKSVVVSEIMFCGKWDE